MYRLIIFFLLALSEGVSFAQLQPLPRVIQQVADPTMVIDDRGSQLEVFPTLRATQSVSPSGKRVLNSVFSASQTETISHQQLGVVFNYAMQVQGYITGEIAFKMKGRLQATDNLDIASLPGFAKLTNPNVYIVVARTPTEFVALTKLLQSRPDIEWVEPAVTYGVLQPAPDAR